MRVVADHKIAAIEEAMSPFGPVDAVPAAAIDRELLLRSQAEVLAVRTRTRVDARLLDQTSVRFVLSATAGLDHIDVAALQARGIALFSSQGQNAPAVAEYVVHAILQARARWPGAFEPGEIAAVVGFGRVGRTVAAQLERLGHPVVVSDPPLEATTDRPDADYVPLALALERAAIVTLHPSLHSGPHATFGLVGRRELAGLRDGALLINTSRGEVLARDAIRDLAHRSHRLAFDVWHDEPQVDPTLYDLANLEDLLATPHIAGYSLDAKLRATQAIHDALGQRLGLAPSFIAQTHLPTEPVRLEPPATLDLPGCLRWCVAQATGLEAVGHAVRALSTVADDARAHAFEQLRAALPARREFTAHLVHWPSGSASSWRSTAERTLASLGFRFA